MSQEQDRMANPYGMDPSCTRCPDLVDRRRTIVHGYGDVAADLVFIGEAPGPGADEAGHPIVAQSGQYSLRALLEAVGLIEDSEDEDGAPRLRNAFITHLTRCHHPERGPSDEEIANCEPFLNAEIRTINPDLLIPLGERVLRTLARDYTTKNPADLEIDTLHATELRGRGFELIPLVSPTNMDDHAFDAAVDRLARTLDRDYRQTKGRRGR